MNKWFLVVVKFTKEFTDGTLKRVTEHNLVSAVSFTDAERQIHHHIGQYIRGEFLVNQIKKKPITDIFKFDDTDELYECKLVYVSEDADSGKEKKISQLYLVTAHNVREAYDRLVESMKGLMITFEIPIIAKSKIQEIFLSEGYQDKLDLNTEEE